MGGTIFSAEALVSLASLTAMEVVLGIDNILVIAILSGKLPKTQQPAVRRAGLGLALVMRVALLFAISWLMGLTVPLFSVGARHVSLRDLVLLAGGGFLIAKATHEVYDKLEGGEAGPRLPGAAPFARVLAQIVLLDLVFSIDGVVTAVGMARALPVMVAAMVLSSLVMLAFAEAVSAFVNRHPSVVILGLCFLLLIGVLLVADSFGVHVDRGYLYFAMAFSLAVEILNMRLRGRHAPVGLHQPLEADKEKG